MFEAPLMPPIGFECGPSAPPRFCRVFSKMGSGGACRIWLGEHLRIFLYGPCRPTRPHPARLPSDGASTGPARRLRRPRSIKPPAGTDRSEDDSSRRAWDLALGGADRGQAHAGNIAAEVDVAFRQIGSTSSHENTLRTCSTIFREASEENRPTQGHYLLVLRRGSITFRVVVVVFVPSLAVRVTTLNFMLAAAKCGIGSVFNDSRVRSTRCWQPPVRAHFASHNFIGRLPASAVATMWRSRRIVEASSEP